MTRLKYALKSFFWILVILFAIYGIPVILADLTRKQPKDYRIEGVRMERVIVGNDSTDSCWHYVISFEVSPASYIRGYFSGGIQPYQGRCVDSILSVRIEGDHQVCFNDSLCNGMLYEGDTLWRAYLCNVSDSCRPYLGYYIYYHYDMARLKAVWQEGSDPQNYRGSSSPGNTSFMISLKKSATPPSSISLMFQDREVRGTVKQNPAFPVYAETMEYVDSLGMLYDLDSTTIRGVLLGNGN